MEHPRCRGGGRMGAEMTPASPVDLLAELVDVLGKAGEVRVQSSLARLLHEFEESTSPGERQQAARHGLRLFGGMGSLQDFVLQDPQGVRPEQARFSTLRSELFRALTAELA